jgi:colicin import membrane protein
VPRTRDEGGMSIRLDPRRLAALKLLAGEQGLRPGELVTRWVEERLDAARTGQQPQGLATPPMAAGASSAELQALSRRIDELAQRLDAFTAAAQAPAEAQPTETAATVGSAPPKRRGRPPKAAAAAQQGAVRRANPAVPLHEEISAVITERGPMTAAELATAIVARGRYAPPRSGKPLDAATVNARVSNPVYRSRFTRDKGRIGLASAS